MKELIGQTVSFTLIDEKDGLQCFATGLVLDIPERNKLLIKILSCSRRKFVGANVILHRSMIEAKRK